MVAGLTVVMAFAVAAVLVGERAGRRWLVRLAKPIASLSFLALGWRLYRPGDPYGSWVLLALTLCLAGDVLLLVPRAFAGGLACFLLGHLAYLAAFHTLRAVSAWPLAWAAPVLTASALVVAWLWPRLGRLRGAVTAYVLAISLMTWGALSVSAAGSAPAYLAVGAVLFYLSDIAVARERFVASSLANRLWGLPAYYLGQLMLALTVGR